MIENRGPWTYRGQTAGFMKRYSGMDEVIIKVQKIRNLSHVLISLSHAFLGRWSLRGDGPRRTSTPNDLQFRLQQDLLNGHKPRSDTETKQCPRHCCQYPLYDHVGGADFAVYWFRRIALIKMLSLVLLLLEKLYVLPPSFIACVCVLALIAW